MITLEQIKNDYVRYNYLASHDLDTWVEFQNYFASRHTEWFEQHWEEVMKIYAMECLKLAYKNAEFYQDGDLAVLDYDSITNENNIIK